MQVLTRGCEHTERVVKGFGGGPLSSPVVTSYRLPIVGLSLTVSQCSDLSWTDTQTGGRTDGETQ